MDMLQDTPSPEVIAKMYSSSLDSVNVIQELSAKQNKTEDEISFIKSNKEHLKIMLDKPFWTNEDLTPFTQAIAL